MSTRLLVFLCLVVGFAVSEEISSTTSAALVVPINAAGMPSSVITEPHGSPGIVNKVIWLGPRLFFRLLTVCAYYVPAQVLALLGTSFSITLSFSSLLIIMAAFGTVVWAVVRYKYLNVYSRLPAEPHRQEPKLDMMFYPNALQRQYEKPGFASYLDEFFTGIKVFGYLEKPVFNELTRHVQTRKLIAGDTMLLEEEKGFCIVVDGDVQIYARTHDQDHSHNEAECDAEGGYQLLTEVKNGAPMSSLFTILSLFTEDIKIATPAERPRSATSSAGHDSLSEETLPIPSDPLIAIVGSPKLLPIPNIPPLSEKVTSTVLPEEANTNLSVRQEGSRATHPTAPGIIARASVDSTIAIIPAEAFRRLTRKYPKSAAHIVQVILARFQRVTFQTGHNYLGLTPEIIKTEIAFNELTRYELPNYLGEDAVARIKAQFEARRPASEQDNETAVESDSKVESTRSMGELKVSKNPSRRRGSAFSPVWNRNDKLEHDVDFTRVLPGDLVSNSSLSWRGGTSPLSYTLAPSPSLMCTSPPARPTVHAKVSTSSLASYGESDFKDTQERDKMAAVKEDNGDEIDTFKQAILECIFKALGVSPESLEGKSPISTSAETSPRLSAYESRRAQQRSIFSARSTGLGNLGPLAFDGINASFVDDESVASSFAHQCGPAQSYNSIKADLLKDIEIVHFTAGSRIVKQGEPNLGLYYVIDGFLDVCTQDRPGEYKTIYTIKPGGIGGYLGSISGYSSFVDIRATTDVYIGFLAKEALERLVDRQPVILLTMAKRLISILSTLILYLDFALEWVQVEAGEVLYKQGDEADSIYIVLNGRMRAIKESKGEMVLVGEYGQGESVGELEVLTSSKRPSTLHAVRDTEVVRFPRMLFESLSMRHPAITIQISRIIASRVNSLVNKEVTSPLEVPSTAPKSGNFRTVAIVPVTSGLPVKEFGERLAKAFTLIGQTNATLDQAAILKHLGRHSFNKFGKLKLSGYLTDLEERYQKVLYVADTAISSPWTVTCISQADCILLLADADADPSIGEYERMLIGMKTTARKELVLLHPDRYVPAGQTQVWLKNRIWIHSHHHVQMQFRNTVPRPTTPHFGARFRDLKNKVQTTLQTELQKYRHAPRLSPAMPVYISSQTHKNDFARLARLLSGKAVGLVLGGGGARGLSHLGVIRALEEAGLPIDIVGGTSIGSFVGGLFARDADIVPIFGRLKKFSGRIGSLWRMFFDLTYPATSYTTGHEFNRGIWKAFGDARIEDFWLQYFNNTTNITHSRMEIHSAGYAWRYIRASMSLAGLLPPITDNGSMLLDGGYLDNLPVSHMKLLGTEVVFAVDVGAIDATTPMTWGDSLSGFWVLFNRWNIFSRHPNVPSMADVQARLAYVSSVGALEKAKALPGCIYMRPPIDQYATLDFGKFEEIYGVGYEFAKDFLNNLQREGKFPQIAGVSHFDGVSRRIIQRRNSI
ncbi:hypothetical protein POJ06DRAFT_194638 [Lipomyces tetrasporus]|uniref:Lysophospholipase NTE1 n=1 Tax=Lipomyces tetrasporus TaxID=54092 RepID=A0AAD7QVC0_9ASCO|nr:uncharacterized protein POJ06DRAFT_194638 [Lipomyces tetrasporus]KAJ8102015.1 hypothetical protein POJ06DRAFT_194638 [Lipomyces tetrasporus]